MSVAVYKNFKSIKNVTLIKILTLKMDFEWKYGNTNYIMLLFAPLHHYYHHRILWVYFIRAPLTATTTTRTIFDVAEDESCSFFRLRVCFFVFYLITNKIYFLFDTFFAWILFFFFSLLYFCCSWFVFVFI